MSVAAVESGNVQLKPRT
ncbi:hypothetical protein A2U01_0108008, partial [Trifolium medium]|nr:hypothetical protein [Trifolium medium]